MSNTAKNYPGTAADEDIVGLTGTPASNGLMDLWAEFRILDMGQRLGRFITKYRTDYFMPDKRNGQIMWSPSSGTRPPAVWLAVISV